MTGKLYIIGLGPGDINLRTTEVCQILPHLTDLVGYAPYVERIETTSNVRRHVSDNRQELERARHALTLAEQGHIVGVISSGDAGIFAMASTVFEAIETGNPLWKQLEIIVLPGLSAMFAAAARLGAPLGHDFCAISLSDNLKPWDVILRRLRLAAEGDFVMALYNPVSRSRPWQLDAAFDLLRSLLPTSITVAFAHAISQDDENIHLTTLAEASAKMADMRTLIIIGSRYSRLIPREKAKLPWFYTPRSIKEN